MINATHDFLDIYNVIPSIIGIIHYIQLSAKRELSFAQKIFYEKIAAL